MQSGSRISFGGRSKTSRRQHSGSRATEDSPRSIAADSVRGQSVERPRTARRLDVITGKAFAARGSARVGVGRSASQVAQGRRGLRRDVHAGTDRIGTKPLVQGSNGE